MIKSWAWWGGGDEEYKETKASYTCLNVWECVGNLLKSCHHNV